MGILDDVVKNLNNQVKTNVSNMFKGPGREETSPVRPEVIQTNTAPQPSASQAVNGFFCPECGTHVEAGGRFCPSCGTAMPDQSVPEAVSPNPMPPQPPIPLNPAPADESSRSIIQKSGPQLRSAAVVLSRATVNPSRSGIFGSQVILLERFVQSLKREICETAVTDQSVPVESSDSIIQKSGPQLGNAAVALSRATVNPSGSGIFGEQVLLLERFIQSLKREIQ